MTPLRSSWLDAPATQAVMRMLVDQGAAAYFVGGCVRNALLGLDYRDGLDDIDISTDARPQDVMTWAEAAGFRAVPTGVDHGTVTVVAHGASFEITTFRRDVATDGRRAVVAFTDDIAQDARRRDFTMNALYADRQGRVVDPLGGLPDLIARRVRFIEDASQRIREDYLRILRFFRFWAHYADHSGGFDAETLGAIAAHLEGLERLSAERIGGEVRKLLAASDPCQAVATMEQIGVWARILPGADSASLARLVALETARGVTPSMLARLAALGGQDPQSRLRLSRAEAKTLTRLQEAAQSAGPAHAIGYWHGTTEGMQILLIRAAMLGAPLAQSTQDALDLGAAAKFPLSARDLMPRFHGAALGAQLRHLEKAWIASEFTLSKAALLAMPPGPETER